VNDVRTAIKGFRARLMIDGREVTVEEFNAAARDAKADVILERDDVAPATFSAADIEAVAPIKNPHGLNRKARRALASDNRRSARAAEKAVARIERLAKRLVIDQQWS
jgi:hypothetical protein